jgi:uncharacterized protein GlcG (DUF336 family)
MASEDTTRRASRRDALRFGGAAGVALAAGAAIRNNALAQDATPAAGGASVTIQAVSIDTAMALIEAARAKASEIGVPMAIAIVDPLGVLKAFARMDGVNSAATVEIVQKKAYTAASFRNPTHGIAEGVADNVPRAVSLVTLESFILLPGGYPIPDGDAVVGGIGVGGGAPEQDMEVAEAALAALGG